MRVRMPGCVPHSVATAMMTWPSVSRRAPIPRSYVDQHTKKDVEIGLIGGQDGAYSSSAGPICLMKDFISGSWRSCSAMIDIWFWAYMYAACAGSDLAS